jgi:hypothetical protein
LRRACLALLALLLAWPCACSDASADARAAALAEAQAALEADPSRALHAARAALSDHGADPRLSLVAGLACQRLERRSEALEHADAGLAVEGLEPGLRAELAWVRGAALMSRYRELSAAADWRAANMALESATQAGAWRVKAAAALAVLQDLGPLGSPERQEKFARLVLQLQPDGREAQAMRALLERRGLSP